MGRYTISDDAAANLAQLTDDMRERGASQESADRFVDGLFASFQNLADFPDIGKTRAYLPAGMLALPHDDHMIIFEKTPDGVNILKVLYGGMDLTAYFGGLQ